LWRCALAQSCFADCFIRSFNPRHRHQLSRRFDWSFAQFFTSGDMIENILSSPLVLRWGALSSRARTRCTSGNYFGHHFICVSAIVEILQSFLAERDPR